MYYVHFADLYVNEVQLLKQVSNMGQYCTVFQRQMLFRPRICVSITSRLVP